MRRLMSLLKSEDGSTAIEYGIIAALMSVASIIAIKYVGEASMTSLNIIGDTIRDNNAESTNKWW